MKFEELQTPCYIVHKEELWNGIKLLKNALETYWNHYIVGYSFKTNALPWALSEMKKAGFYAEVVSEDEYLLAKKLGFSHIIYNGPIKEKKTFLEALRQGQIVNLDAMRELYWLEESGLTDVRIGLRVNFDLESICPGETSSAKEGGRFGYSYETGAFAEALGRLEKMGIKLSGLHLHASSKTRSVDIYRALARMACKLKKEFDLSLDYVDMGGGYFGGMDNKPKFPDYVKAVREELLSAFSVQETMLVMEPGTSLITPPIEYLTTVIDCKDIYTGRFVVTDGSRSDIDPLHGKSSYFHKLLYRIPEEKGLKGIASASEVFQRKKLEKQVICGFTCMENDRLYVEREQPELRPGDQISYQKIGGYTMCLTPLFIRYLPTVYLEENGEYTCIREHWGVDEYVQKCVY